MTEATFSIQGMNCGHCVKAVHSAVSSVPGAIALEVAIGSAKVSWDEERTSLEVILEAVEDEGYKVVRP